MFVSNLGFATIGPLGQGAVTKPVVDFGDSSGVYQEGTGGNMCVTIGGVKRVRIDTTQDTHSVPLVLPSPGATGNTQLNAYEVLATTLNFTGSGVSVTPNITLHMHGQTVTILVAAMSFTPSLATNVTSAAIPARFWPAVAQACSLVATQAGVGVTLQMNISAAGIFTIQTTSLGTLTTVAYVIPAQSVSWCLV